MSIEIFPTDGDAERFNRLVALALDCLPTPLRTEIETLSPRIHCISAKRGVVKFSKKDMGVNFRYQLSIGVKAEYFAKATDIGVVMTLLHEFAHQLGVDDETEAERLALEWAVAAQIRDRLIVWHFKSPAQPLPGVGHAGGRKRYAKGKI
jgi:hypothetical protein